MRPRHLLSSAALAVIAWSQVSGQANATVRDLPRIGIIGGANLATLAGSDVNDASMRTGFAGGLMAVLPVAPGFAIQPELMFTMKGANSNSSEASAAAKIDYVEIPVLARFEIPASGSVKPFVYGGPGFAYKASCKLEGTSQGTTVSFDCDDLNSLGVPSNVKFSSTDVGGIIGGGLAFDVGGRTMTVGVRYEIGFVKFVTDSEESRALVHGNVRVAVPPLSVVALTGSSTAG